MNDQPEALRVADELEALRVSDAREMWLLGEPAARLLREQHAEIERLREHVDRLNATVSKIAMQQLDAAKAEREECARVCEQEHGACWHASAMSAAKAAERCAAAIRARGET